MRRHAIPPAARMSAGVLPPARTANPFHRASRLDTWRPVSMLTQPTRQSRDCMGALPPAVSRRGSHARVVPAPGDVQDTGKDRLDRRRVHGVMQVEPHPAGLVPLVAAEDLLPQRA